MEPIHRRRDFLQRAGALLLSGTLLGGCAARRPAAPGLRAGYGEYAAQLAAVGQWAGEPPA